MMEMHPRLRKVVLRADATILALSEHPKIKNQALQVFCKDRIELIQSSIIADCHKPKPVTIALVGETGAGKSTLINAILECSLLPVSTSKACTAAIAEISYHDNPNYEATIDFISRESWEKELEALLGDFRDTQQAESDVDAKSEDKQELIRMKDSARQKISAIYGDVPITEILSAKLKELPEISAALDSQSRAITHGELSSLEKDLSRYLDSDYSFWPIVKAVKIRGPFKALQNGITLVDLPGLNDPNEAREAVTNQYLKSCRFVWLVFRIERVLNRGNMAVLSRPEMIRQLIMDGRDHGLTFIATKSDDITKSAAIKQFKLPDTASKQDGITRRNQEAVSLVKEQLKELAEIACRAADGGVGDREWLEKRFMQCQVFTVSANEYLRLAGVNNDDPNGIINVERTEIPKLHAHMDNMCMSYGIQVRADTHLKQLKLIAEELRTAIAAECARLANEVMMTEQKREGLKRAASAARNFLREQLDKAHAAYDKRLIDDQVDLLAKLDDGIDKSKKQIDQVLSTWSNYYWSTLHATVRRDGRFPGSSTGKKDLPADLANPILDAISVAWAEYFGDKLGASIDKASNQLRVISAEFASHHLLKLVSDVGGDVAEYSDSLRKMVKASEKVLGEIVSQSEQDARDFIEETRRTLYEQIMRQIESNMLKYFRKAAAESGLGMKARILATLADGARTVSTPMYDDVRRDIQKGMRSVIDVMSRKHVDMIEHIKRQSNNSIENIYQDDALNSVNADESVLLSGVLATLDKEISATLYDLSPEAITL